MSNKERDMLYNDIFEVACESFPPESFEEGFDKLLKEFHLIED